MNIEIVRDLGDSYLVNEIMSVPKNIENREYRKIQKWIEQGGFVVEEDLLNNVKNSKIADLKARRDYIVSNQKEVIQGSSFTLDQSKLPMLQGRIDRLTNDTDTLGWNDDSGNRVQLNKTAFESLLRHIQVQDITVWDLYSDKLDELETVYESGDLDALNSFETDFLL